MRKSRVLAIIMAVLMVVTLLPSMVFATAAPSGALDGTLKIKGNAAVGTTLSADYSKVKPEGITDDLVDFSWSLKDGDLLTEVSTEKTYKIDEAALGLPIILKITGKADKGLSGELTAQTYEVSATEEEAKALAEQKKSENKDKEKTEEAVSEETADSAETEETAENETAEASGDEEKAQSDAEADSTQDAESDAASESSETENTEDTENTDSASSDSAVVEVDGDSENSEAADAAQEEPSQDTAETDSSEKNTDAVETDDSSDQQTEEDATPDAGDDSSSEDENQEGTYKLSADNQELSFDALTEGYTDIETRTVTIKNDGTETITLLQPVSDHFDIAPISDVETDGDIQLAADGGEQTFTVQPKQGLSSNSYTDELVFSAKENENASVTVTAQVTVNAAVEEKTEVTVDPAELDFGSLEQGYSTAPEAQKVTVTNTGNVAVRLDQPKANSYEVGELAEVLNPGESAAFTIQPKAGLPVGESGEYNGKIYIRDLDGNELGAVNVSFAVTQPEPVYDLTIAPESLEFGSAKEGYKSAPEAQKVTVTNAGNTDITLQQPKSKSYTIGNLSKTEIAAGESASFTVQPKSGLTKDEYLEDITVENSGNVECYVNAHFSVTKKSDNNDDKTEKLTGIKKPSDIKDLPNGTEKSQKALKLPSTVKITTSKGEKKASVKWDVKGCSYNPSSSDRQTFNVKGTVTLPDGVKNPDKISTVIAVSVTVNGYTGSQAKESDNKITGIDANGKYDTNSKITFTAVGAGMNNENPKKGDTRFLPASWKITETRTWDAAPYTATFRVSKPGQYTLKVTFAQQKYDGSKWANTGKNSESQVTFTVSEAAALTATPSPAVTGANKKSAVQTGDSTPIMTFVIILVVAVVCIGGILVYRKKKK